MANKKVLIIGPIPPPSGGVGIHILRLSKLLQKDFDLDFIDESRKIKKRYHNIRGNNLLFYLKKVKTADLIYIHSGKNILRIFHLLIGKIFLKKLIITIHSYPARKSKLIGYIIGFICRIADTIVIVNSEIKVRLLLPDKKCIIKEAFIPPSIEDEPELPKHIFEWLLKNNKVYPIISANASNLDTYNNHDLYGLDLCIAVTKRLLEKNIPVKFVFIVASAYKNQNKFLKNQTLIKELDLDKNFLLINEDLSFVKIIQSSDIVLRPTNTDGDAITIREGLFLNKPVLASDVVKRPSNTFLFKNRNIDDLELQLKKLIQKKDRHEYYSTDYSDLIQDFRIFYSKLINNTLSIKN